MPPSVDTTSIQSHPIRHLMPIAAVLLCGGLGLAAERIDQPLPDGWGFVRAEAPLSADASSWTAVTVPHTWNAADVMPLVSTGKEANRPNPYRGPGWYARSLTLDPAWKGRRVFLRLEAASLVSQVHLNGHPLGEHRGGFTASCYDLTPHLDWTKGNDLRIRVDNSKVSDVAPLQGDFNVQGGLYRPVHLLVTDPACITPLDHGSSGVLITPVSVSEASAELRVRTRLLGLDPGAEAEVMTELLAADGTVVASATSPKLGAVAEHTATLTVAKPHRWQGRNDPYLYTCRVSLRTKGAVGDRVEIPYGIRTVQITDDQGFLLNGVPYPVHGVNRHQDVAGKGWALSPEDHDRDLALITEMGATAIRLAHYPQSEYLHRAADRLGLLLWDEVSLVDKTTPGEEFAANAEQQLRELVLQLGNHPSVAFWGLYNEIGGDFERNAALLQRLKDAVTTLDGSRLIVGATCVKANPMHTVPDWNCWNKYPGWYGGAAGTLGQNATDAAKEINRRIGISEYGAGANIAHHQEDESIKVAKTTQVFHPEEYQAYNHEKNWASIAHHPRVWGSFLWNMFDFTAANRNEGGYGGLNDKGLVTYDRAVRKDAFFFYKANWNPEPMVHLCSQRFTTRTQAQVAVKAYSTVGALTLTVNGTVIGKADPNETRAVRWDKVALRTGPNTVVVSGTSGGKTLDSSATWTFDPKAAAPAP